jgi:hypothetical protein
MPLVARQPQRSEYSDLHTYCQAFTISGRIAMSAGQVSAGFLFWAQRPQIAGMTATQKKLRRRVFPLFFAQMPKGFEDIFGNSESIGKSVRREILAQDKT